MRKYLVLTCCREENGKLGFFVPLNALGYWALALTPIRLINDKLYVKLDEVKEYYQENLNLTKDKTAKQEYQKILKNLDYWGQRAREEAKKQSLETGECFDIKVIK